jgi:branched-chain amino acid transport system ATP-binding protein
MAVERLLAAVRQAADSEGLAVLLVEQQARRAMSAADRWYLLRNGCVDTHGDSAGGLDALEAAYLASMTDNLPVAGMEQGQAAP